MIINDRMKLIALKRKPENSGDKGENGNIKSSKI